MRILVGRIQLGWMVLTYLNNQKAKTIAYKMNPSTRVRIEGFRGKEKAPGI